MAKPNYSFAKRQRDLAKEQKKEEKLQRKKASAEEAALSHDAESDMTTDEGDAPKDPASDA
ncbi:hypothetical protein PHLH5_05480 [Pseudomonas sp. Cab53]|uniref:DUF4169 family protein n=3 Tax=Pseudomonas TaxID=286 RepID=A0A0G3GAC7_9PSED|nr:MULTISPECIES: hypothetical protein [Pseudomonas]AKJ97479.1 hypothetical protein VM99_05215 [Pseudomonas chlororaphis]KIQ57861.1 hypothetical protein RL74_18720 [Pseudomonas fluorescens]ROM80769.1 hypothetical protein BK652_19145 [Pseudomonas brassicacearum]BBP63007.1 hypothetical protein PHLH5_05480 [Pseudomonas sp. Cab53]